jgi:short subunit dehydrogenase-like uncharacterized protein
MVGRVNDRDLDVVVFGATGITGRQVAAYLAERSSATGARWAAAARDVAKLERVLGEIGVSAPEALAADVDDADSLAAMAARARVVLNLVGPYTRFGRPVIEACVAAGSHYVDLTGEIPFVRRVIDAFDARAAEAGAKVVQVCGFEALPPDLAVQLAVETARERWGENLAAADLEVSVKAPPGMPRLSDAVSGGTLQSAAEIAVAEDAAAVSDPAALIDDPDFAAEVRRRSPITVVPRRGAGGSVVAPMAPAAFINPAVIHRTAALHAAGDGEGEPFRYREGMAMRGGTMSLPIRYAVAGALAGTQAAIAGVSRARPSVRRRVGSALRRILPSSGFGPTQDRLEGWRWGMSMQGRTTGGHQIAVEVEAEGNPGYLTTARMLGEAGLLLAEPGLTPERAGCLTPAVALGTASVQRFEEARVRFRVS